MASRFVNAGSVDDFSSEQENKSTVQKNTPRCQTITIVFGDKERGENIENIPTEYVSDIIISVRTKDGKQLLFEVYKQVSRDIL